MVNYINIRYIKKTISIFFILLLGFNSFGLFFFYWGEIQLCKIKADEYSESDYISAKSPVIFSSETNGFELINSNEILAQGRLYDIVKTARSDGKTLYFAVSDEDEDRYVQNLTELEKSNCGEKSLPGKTINVYLAKYFRVDKCYNCNIVLLPALQEDIKNVSDSFFYKSPFTNIFSPPPDNLS